MIPEGGYWAHGKCLNCGMVGDLWFFTALGTDEDGSASYGFEAGTKIAVCPDCDGLTSLDEMPEVPGEPTKEVETPKPKRETRKRTPKKATA